MVRAREFLGPYRLVRLIRVGNTTAVWEAAKGGLEGDRYALKVLREDLRDNDAELDQMQNEFTVGKNLKHPNIIKIHEFNQEGLIPFLVMELYECPNLKLLLRNPGHAAIAYLVPKAIEQAAKALFYMHDEGWVHRDVKPDNFLVSDEGHVKLIDFAISTKKASGLSALFSFGSKKVQGTRSYMSPEQIRGKPLDARADIYSFGCLLFELVSGKLPYTGSTADELLSKHLSAAIPSVQMHNDNVTAEFANLVKSMMAKNKEERPATMWEFMRVYTKLSPFKILTKPPEGKLVLPRETLKSPDDLKRIGPQG